MDQRIAENLDHGAIEFGLPTGNDKLHLFAEILSEITNHAGETIEDMIDRQHSRLHDLFLDLRRDASKMGGRLLQILYARLGGVLLREARGQFCDAGLVDD